MPYLNKCVFCAHGITDDAGCRCGVSELMDGPDTPTLIRWALKAECADAQERYERRVSSDIILMIVDVEPIFQTH